MQRERRIFNSTVGGELEVYERRDFNSLFHNNGQILYSRDAKAIIDETELISNLFISKKENKGVMLDVGACGGGSAAHFEKLGWEIYCFEPDPNNRENLKKKYGNNKNVVIDSRAISNQKLKEQNFYNSKESVGISSLITFHHSHRLSCRVGVTTIEEVLIEYNIKRIDFLKIDVEGMDFNVLKGIPWHEIKPAVIECEFEDEKTKQLGHTWTDISNFLLKQGYTVYVSEWHPIIRYGIRHDWLGIKCYPCKLENPKAWGNLLAFKIDPGLSVINNAVKKTFKADSPELTTDGISLKNATKNEDNENNNIEKIHKNEESEVINSSKKKFIPIQYFKSIWSPIYIQIEKWIKNDNIAIFHTRQFISYILHLFQRNPKVSAIVIFALVTLLALSVINTPLMPHISNIWSIVGVSFFSTIVILGLSFIHYKLVGFVQKVNQFKLTQRSEIIFELNKVREQFTIQINEKKKLLNSLVIKIEENKK